MPPLLEELRGLDEACPGDIYLCGALAELRLGHRTRAEGLIEDGLRAHPASVDLRYMRFLVASLHHALALRNTESPGHPLHRTPCRTHSLVERAQALFKEQGLAYSVVQAPLISLCMIVRDEEAHLERAIRSALPLVDEVVVVDTGSRDGTMDLARLLGARVECIPWEKDFSKARNASLDRARGRYALVLDGDEELEFPSEDREALRRLLASGEAPEVLTARVVSPLGSSRGAWEELPSPRLFRNDGTIRYRYPAHNQLMTKGKVLSPSRLKIIHHGYSDRVVLRWKLLRTLDLLKGMEEDHPFRLLHEIRINASLGQYRKVTRLMGALRARLGGALTAETAPACAMAVLSHLALGEREEARELNKEALEACPGSVDLRFTALALAGLKHLEAIRGTDKGLCRLPLRTEAQEPIIRELLARAGLFFQGFRPLAGAPKGR